VLEFNETVPGNDIRGIRVLLATLFGVVLAGALPLRPRRRACSHA
jgi:hypothetical protein